MEYSCLKTLGRKYKCKISKICDKYRAGAKRWGIPYETKAGMKRWYLTKFNEIDGKRSGDIVPQSIFILAKSKTTFDDRLKAKVCELCGRTATDKYEVHHVNKINGRYQVQRTEK